MESNTIERRNKDGEKNTVNLFYVPYSEILFNKQLSKFRATTERKQPICDCE